MKTTIPVVTVTATGLGMPLVSHALKYPSCDCKTPQSYSADGEKLEALTSHGLR
jgi:hypothetical protein